MMRSVFITHAKHKKVANRYSNTSDNALFRCYNEAAEIAID